MRLPHVLATPLVALVLSSSAQAQSPPPAAAPCHLPRAPGVSQVRLVSGPHERSYRLFVPPRYDGHTPQPLVLDLHGSGDSSAGEARNSGFETVAAREGFLVATLQADGGRWNFPVEGDRADDVAYVGDVISHVGTLACTDRARVYVAGFSGGGRMTSLLGCRLSARIAAIASVSGLRWPAPCAGRPMPVLTFHGLADGQNPYDGRAAGRGAEWFESVPEALAAWARHNGCGRDVIRDDPAGPLSTMRYDGCDQGADVRLIRIDGLGHTWAKREVDTTEVIWRFFASHRLGV